MKQNTMFLSAAVLYRAPRISTLLSTSMPNNTVVNTVSINNSRTKGLTFAHGRVRFKH